MNRLEKAFTLLVVIFFLNPWCPLVLRCIAAPLYLLGLRFVRAQNEDQCEKNDFEYTRARLHDWYGVFSWSLEPGTQVELTNYHWKSQSKRCFHKYLEQVLGSGPYTIALIEERGSIDLLFAFCKDTEQTRTILSTSNKWELDWVNPKPALFSQEYFELYVPQEPSSVTPPKPITARVLTKSSETV